MTVELLPAEVRGYTSEQLGNMWRGLVPMAVSLAFGVLFTTFIALIQVPVSYLILDDVQRIARRMSGLEAPA